MKNTALKNNIEFFLKELEKEIELSLHVKSGFPRNYFEGWGYVGRLESDTDFGFAKLSNDEFFNKNGFYGQRRYNSNSIEIFKSEIISDIRVCIQSAIDWAEGWGHNKKKYQVALNKIDDYYNLNFQDK